MQLDVIGRAPLRPAVDMQMDFSTKDRVRISPDYHWAKNVVGTICDPPESVVRLTSDWKGCRRAVESKRGPLTFYWVEFDSPQFDADQDGPYAAGEIDSRFLSQEHDTRES